MSPVGALKTCGTRLEIDHARTYVDKARPLGIPVEFWEKGRISAALGTHAYEGAVFDPNAGYVHPIKLVQVLKLAAEAAGVTVYEDSPVQHIEEGPVIRVHLFGGQTVKARSLILATNAYTPRLGYFRNAIAPIYNYVAATASLSDQRLAALGWQSRLPFHDSKRLVHYLGLTRDNRIHIGGGSAAYEFNNGVEERPDAGAIAQLRQELARLYPMLQGTEFELFWDGLVDMTLDWAPLVGVMGKYANIFYGLGYCGHGVNLAFLFGRIIADLEAGKAQEWSGLHFLNRRAPYIPNEPFRWLGIEGDIAYSRFAR